MYGNVNTVQSTKGPSIEKATAFSVGRVMLGHASSTTIITFMIINVFGWHGRNLDLPKQCSTALVLGLELRWHGGHHDRPRQCSNGAAIPAVVYHTLSREIPTALFHGSNTKIAAMYAQKGYSVIKTSKRQTAGLTSFGKYWPM